MRFCRLAPRWLAPLLATAAISASPVASADPAAAHLARYIELLGERMPHVASATLEEIDGTSRRLLAARAYLRAGPRLTERWSWTQQRIDAHVSSEEYAALIAEVDRVRQRFEQQNPGYTLYANTRVRSLDEQIVKFNTNPSVGTVGRALESAVLREIASYGVPPQQGVERLAEFLKAWRPPVAAPLAAPGLSMHGQLRAIDFQIMKDGKIVAGTEVASVRRQWEEQGWKRKLQLAMDQSPFKGPLQSPNEPWHYEYVPPAGRVARND